MIMIMAEHHGAQDGHEDKYLLRIGGIRLRRYNGVPFYSNNMSLRLWFHELAVGNKFVWIKYTGKGKNYIYSLESLIWIWLVLCNSVLSWYVAHAQGWMPSTKVHFQPQWSCSAFCNMIFPLKSSPVGSHHQPPVHSRVCPFVVRRTSSNIFWGSYPMLLIGIYELDLVFGLPNHY